MEKGTAQVEQCLFVLFGKWLLFDALKDPQNRTFIMRTSERHAII